MSRVRITDYLLSKNMKFLENQSEKIREMRSTGHSIRVIAEYLSVPQHHLTKYLKALKEPLPKGKCKGQMNQTILEDFISKGLHVEQIAEAVGTHKMYIWKLAKNYGLSLPRKVKEFECKTCGEVAPHKFSDDRKERCKKCQVQYTKQRSKDQKKDLRDHMGGKCIACGYSSYKSALEIHHLDPSKKDRNFSGHSGWSWGRLLKEVEDCVLLCSCCHRAHHNGYLNIEPFLKINKISDDEVG